jgi:hypothetical protein
MVRLIRERVQDVPLDAVPDRIEKFKSELGLQIGHFGSQESRPPEFLGAVEPLAWAVLLGQALLGAAFEGKGPVRPEDRLSLEIDEDRSLWLVIDRPDGVPIRLAAGSVGISSAQRVDVGRPDRRVGIGSDARERWAESQNIDGHPLSTVLLLPIGDRAGDIADGLAPLVADVVQIDDRPSRGGGLPDFWQSNLSRVIRASLANPNIAVVLAVGDAESARHTLKWLKEAVPSELDLQQRTRLPVLWVQTYLRRGLDIRVAPAKLDEVLEQLHAASLDDAPIDYNERVRVDLERARSRRRLFTAEPDSGQRLDFSDGLRTRSLADAYPQALQMIRGDGGRQGHQELHRRSFREISAFKLVLTRPLTDIIPEFWEGEKSILDEYYELNFKGGTGIFGRHLTGPHGKEPDMSAFAARATADAVRQRQPTRRILLPIVSDELDQPLGLSAIQIFPRAHEGRWRLDAIWVWRTVDALVGFPFSAYGSISWTRDFLQRVRLLLESCEGGEDLSMGELTYLALSFHLYLHEGDQEIARAIVHDASR